MTQQRVAAIQMVSGLSLNDNLIRADRLIEQAARAGAQLVVLPEYFAVLDSSQFIALGQAETVSEGPIRSFLSRAARTYGVWVVGGTLPTAISMKGEIHPEKIYAASFVYDSQGKEVVRYDKIHLFDVTVEDNQTTYQESKTAQAGEQVVVVDTPVGKLGLSVCYDIRFPELYRKLRDAGAQIFAVPAAFTEVTGKAHWESLLRARAIESFCYVIAAGQGGVHENQRCTFGDSMVVDSWGTILNRLPKGEGVVIADIDLEKQAEIRKQMPTHAHHRLT